MLLSLSIFGVFLSLILLYNKRRYKSSVYLSLFFLFSSLYMFYQYILLYSKSVTFISGFLFNISIAGAPVYLIGPMLYWYVRSVLSDNAKLTRNDLWHFLPMVIYFITSLPHAFLPWNEKVAIATIAAEDTGYIGIYKATLLTRVFPQSAVFVSRLMLILGYTIWSMVLFYSYLKKKKISAVFSKQLFMKKWLYCLLGFVFILVSTQIPLLIRTFQLQFAEYYLTLKVIQAISAIGLIGLLVSPFLFPSVLYGLPRVPEKTETTDIDAEDRPDQAESPGRKSLSFETDYLLLIEEKVVSFMEMHKPYLEPDCNLAYLSKLINVPAHHLSYYFREVKKQPFNDFRNEWRINHAKDLIKEGKANEITLEAIGMLSGFSSRNAFTECFKKVEGVSPSTFAYQKN